MEKRIFYFLKNNISYSVFSEKKKLMMKCLLTILIQKKYHTDVIFVD